VYSQSFAGWEVRGLLANNVAVDPTKSIVDDFHRAGSDEETTRQHAGGGGRTGSATIGGKAKWTMNGRGVVYTFKLCAADRTQVLHVCSTPPIQANAARQRNSQSGPKRCSCSTSVCGRKREALSPKLLIEFRLNSGRGLITHTNTLGRSPAEKGSSDRERFLGRSDLRRMSLRVERRTFTFCLPRNEFL